MRKLLCLILAVVLAASMTVMAVSAAQTEETASGAGSATVKLIGAKGNSVTKTYAVGDTITAYTYLNVAQIGDGKVASFTAYQNYTDSVLELADAYDNENPESYDYGLVTDLETMFPICGSGSTIANAGESGVIYYNSSKANGYTFNSDTSALIVTHYTVTAAGEATITNSFETLAQADFSLTRIVDRGVVKNDNFTTPVALSEPTLPIVTGSTVSGVATSFRTTTGEGDDDVTLKLTGADNNFTASVTVTATYAGTAVGAKAQTEYAIEEVPAGEYKLSVEKKNHVTREYDVTVGEDTALNVQINPIGDADLNGRVMANDAMLAYKEAQVKGTLSGYAFKCADVSPKGNPNGKVQANDAMDIYKQAQNKHNLF